MNGEIQRAELFANVDELMAWKKCFSTKQTELLVWQRETAEAISNVLSGCQLLIDADQEMTKRIDIANKRIRHLEEAVGRLTPR